MMRWKISAGDSIFPPNDDEDSHLPLIVSEITPPHGACDRGRGEPCPVVAGRVEFV
jgi:hypothetical protein